MGTALEDRKAFWADHSTHSHGPDIYHRQAIKCLTSIRAIQQVNVISLGSTYDKSGSNGLE